MAYVALYRQWRPQNFDTLVGQQPVKTALSNALRSGKIAHAYLFSGPRGTGKTSTARILAKALNCESGPTPAPCGKCSNCERIAAGTSMDVFEIDAASNRGIDEIKALRERLAFAPAESRYKIYIIDEVHMLTTEAFNALLKTLEEPPAHVIFILATTDPHKIPATIHSRCQRFDFRRVTVEEIAEHLALVAQGSGIEAEPEALRMIAIQSEGGMRDALSLLDQCGVMSKVVTSATVREVLGIVGRDTLRELVQAIGRQNLTETLAKLNFLLEQGKDARQVLTELAEYLRAVLLYASAPSYTDIYLTDTAEELAKAVPLFSMDRLVAAEERLHTAIWELKNTMRQRITAELCLLDLCRIEGSTVAALTARVAQLEKQLASGAVNFVPQPAYNMTQEAIRPAAVQKEAKESVFPLAAASEIVQETKPATVQAVLKAEARSSSAIQRSEAPKSPSAPRAPERTSAPVEDYAGDWATGEDYWKQALELLKNEGKRSVVSCAQNGRVSGFVNGKLQVAYNAPFLCLRMNKDDYRLAIEDALLRLTRQAIKLECIEASSLKKAAPKPVVKQEAPGTENPNALKAEELPGSLRKAMDVLGGTIEKT